MVEENHLILNCLSKLKITEINNFVKYSDSVRDRDDVFALKCDKTGIIILNRTSHINEYYKNKPESPFYEVELDEVSSLTNNEDDTRRAEMFQNIILQKNWCDFGTGLGNILKYLSPIAKKSISVELQKTARNFVNKNGHKCYESIDDYPGNDLDIVTLFHVFEHLDDPIGILKNIRKKMNDNGTIIIEVPHAKDILLNGYDLESFKNFTLWSEHLILHTRESLRLFIEEAGFKNVVIKGFQRYSLSNHTYWLRHGKPGGHKKWSHLNSNELDLAYKNSLNSIDQTDTLIAYANK